MPGAKKQKNSANSKAHRAISSTQSLSAFVKSICDIMRRSNCASALQYVPELTWILFLRILDAQEAKAREAAEAVGKSFAPALREPYRWRDWAAPYDEKNEVRTPEGKPVGWKRKELTGKIGDLFVFINKELLPYLHTLDILPDGRPNEAATPKQRVIGRIMTAVEKVRVDSETNLCDILDRVNEISIDHIDDRHFFTLSQVYEDLLLKMGEKNSDGGQFFTPREVIRAMVRVIDPQPGETIYDPGCGTGGFLAQSYELLEKKLGVTVPSTELERLKHDTFYGREKENLVFPIALANLVLHGIDQPNLWHGNTLSNTPTYAGLFHGAPETFDVVLTNPPFGGKEGKDAQKNFSFETSSTQVLFLQHILSRLRPPLNGKPGGRCGVVLDEGLLFRTNENAFVETKRKLFDECELWCIVSLPGGVFSAAGAGVKTNLLFFTKGTPTKKIWYYDLSHVKVGKKTPMTLAHFGWGPNGEVLYDPALPATLVGDWPKQDGHKDKPFPTFARLISQRGTPEAESDFSWTVDFTARRTKARDDMAPHLAEVEKRINEAVALKDKIATLKRAKASEANIESCREELALVEKAQREAKAKADTIDAATFDLKAVNPRARVIRDTRSVGEILESIERHGQTVQESLATLRKQLVEG
ncbi:MAG: Restriction endonuclease subunit M [Candidatus Nitrospira kreftii]|uniref:site-specific DNA-methyltransferase (adenine-specific) n=1 Tax=Candidatus Nitrospira kreftii TaxID=2652173 RepID=A0A7S8IY69_9BACT|nr:MAG: Restriction endonuclease subunit M [Candidatus Nitrospira kreftii]